MSDIGVELVVPLWRPARSFPFPALNGATLQLIGGAGLWVGVAVEETTGAGVGRVVIGDGNPNGVQTLFAPYTLAANESRSDMWPSRGVMFESGLVVTATAGTVAGALWAVMLTRDEVAAINAARFGEQGT